MSRLDQEIEAKKPAEDSERSMEVRQSLMCQLDGENQEISVDNRQYLLNVKKNLYKEKQSSKVLFG